MIRDLDPGSVTLVGGGPGDPGLITVQGLHAIRQADVLVYDRLAPLECLAEARPGAQLIDVGKIPRGRQTPQERINEILVSEALLGHRVVRLKGGDSFVFGRGGEEWQACAAAGVPVHVVPGVTSAVAVPELAGIPVTHRSLTQGFTVVSGHVPPGDPRGTVDWAALARTRTTLVILMGVTYLPQIVEALRAAGLDGETGAAVVASAVGPTGCTTSSRVLRGTLADISRLAAGEHIEPPAVVVIGAVVDLHLDEPHPADPRPVEIVAGV
ncbi:MAG: uroporphyrinogen-III C-methyltransferase [Austwickia sp.]|nr:uroporphyrinogen-III C-methyltransferase [Actinomycetota bacterium]MCO5309132.1 uroporphyrinogen-III C-methyltransferase [Austwickia sp.]